VRDKNWSIYRWKKIPTFFYKEIDTVTIFLDFQHILSFRKSVKLLKKEAVR
jgi:hypothetical protein